MLVTEHVRFIMPKSREYQFGAMAVVQQFVNGFQPKSQRNDISQGEAQYALRYCLQMPYEDLAFFVASAHDRITGKKTSMGLELSQPPEEALDEVTMEIDMSDARLDMLKDTGKHLVQVCGLMCGVLISALPVVRKVQIRYENGYKWLESPTAAALLAVGNKEVTGVIGWRGAETYQAAAMGLAVIELDGPEYPAWLTKWGNPLYRRIESQLALGSGFCDIENMLVERTKRVVEAALEEIVRRCQIQEAVAVVQA